MAGSGTAHLRSPEEAMLRVENLVVEFPVGRTGLKVNAVSNISLDVKEGETLYSLAGRYFAPLPRPAGLWWIIADFQPDPIHDPTLALDVGRALVVPSVRVVTEEILSEQRRQQVGS